MREEMRKTDDSTRRFVALSIQENNMTLDGKILVPCIKKITEGKEELELMFSNFREMDENNRKKLY